MIPQLNIKGINTRYMYLISIICIIQYHLYSACALISADDLLQINFEAPQKIWALNCMSSVHPLIVQKNEQLRSIFNKTETSAMYTLHCCLIKTIVHKNTPYAFEKYAINICISENGSPDHIANLHSCYTDSDPDGCYLQSIFIKKEYRKLGLGSLLVTLLQEKDVATLCGNYDEITLDSMPEAELFYQKLGYEKSANATTEYPRYTKKLLLTN